MVTIDETHLDQAWPNFSHLVSGFLAARDWSRDIPEGVVFRVDANPARIADGSGVSGSRDIIGNGCKKGYR